MTRERLLILLICAFVLPAALMAQENHCPVQKSPKRMAIEAGQTIYAGQCQTCHQADGSGSANAGISLIKSASVMGDKQHLIELLAVGKNNGAAPHLPSGQPEMTDEQIANVLTYIRNSFGNNGSMVKTDEVRHVRGNNK